MDQAAQPTAKQTDASMMVNKKRQLRQQMRSQLAQLDAAQIQQNSDKIMQHLLAMPQLASAASLFVYVARQPEVDTRALLDTLLRCGLKVAVPRIVDDGNGGSLMQAVYISDTRQLQSGRFGLMEPLPGNNNICVNPDVVLVPGVAFDDAGGRLGQGAGYYDKWFALNPDSQRIAIAHSLQLVREVPMEQHDKRMQFMVTEHGSKAVPAD